MSEEDFQTINRILGELSKEEHRILMYLCSDLDADCCTEDLQGLLKSLTARGQVGPLFMLELMFKMRRFDILKNVLGTNRQEVEGLLGNEHVVSDYRTLMADVSENISKEDLHSLIFLLNGILPRGRQESATSFLDVVEELEKLDKVSSEKVDLIEECLRNIRRVDLARKVNQYQSTVPATRRDVSPRSQRLEPTIRMQQLPCHRTMALKQAPPPEHLCPVRAAARENVRMPVPESGRQYCQGSLERYRMQTNPLGVCVIIDCVGSGDMLEETFRRLHFRVSLHKWPGMSEMRAILREASAAQQELREADAFACCIVSRHSGAALLATEEHGLGLTLHDIARLFRTNTCRELAGKPKLFFVQSYIVPEQDPARHGHRPYNDEDLETDGPAVALRSESVPSDADFFWSQCSVEARQLEEGGHESVYLKTLCTALLAGQAREQHLLDAHTEVNSVVYEHNRRNPGETYSLSLRHTLRKCLFFS